MKYRNNFVHKTLRYVWDYIGSVLPTWPKKIAFLLAIVTCELLSAYVIAAFDVGIRVKEADDFSLPTIDLSISGMLKAYRAPDEAFPWGVFLVITLCILLVVAMIIWKYGIPPGGRNFKLSKSDVYGSGREISQKEILEVADVSHKNATVCTIIGQMDDTGTKVITSKPAVDSPLPNDNSLIFAPPGCGKTTSYVLPYLIQAKLRRHSVIAADTKGELYAKTAESFRQAGYRVLRLDLKDPVHSDGWHVLKELRHDDVRALIFAQTVMANTGNPHDNFAAPQESLLKACCLYQERHPELSDSQRTFYNAFSLLLQGAETLDATITTAFNNFGECMQVVADSYATFLQGSPNLRGNIITGLANRLQILASPPVREMTSTDEIDFASIGEIPTVLYIAMSDQHQAMSFLASLAFSFAFQDLVDHADSLPGKRLKIPVCFLMEEFYSLGKLPNIGNILSTGRSRGISISIVVQSLSQLIERYEENLTNTILADCATWILLGSADPDTSKLWEWRSGEATVNVQTLQHDAMEPPFRLSHRRSTGDGRRNFYTSNDVIKVKPKKEVLIAWNSYDILKARSFPIFMHQEFVQKRMPEISDSALIPLSNKKAKEIFRQWENERIAAFNKWLECGGDPLLDYSIPHRKRPTGPASNEPMPEFINIHTLERMALSKAAGKRYEPRSDPDHPLYDERYDPDSPKYNPSLVAQATREATEKQESAKSTPVLVKEQPLWDLTGLKFEKVELQVQEEQTATETPSEEHELVPLDPESMEVPITSVISGPTEMPPLDVHSEGNEDPLAFKPEDKPDPEPAAEFTVEQVQIPEDPLRKDLASNTAESSTVNAEKANPMPEVKGSKSADTMLTAPVAYPQPTKSQRNIRGKDNSYAQKKEEDSISSMIGGGRKVPPKNEKIKTSLDGSHKKMPPKKTETEGD